MHCRCRVELAPDSDDGDVTGHLQGEVTPSQDRSPRSPAHGASETSQPPEEAPGETPLPAAIAGRAGTDQRGTRNAGPRSGRH
jgi:hypothetical protein